MRRLLVIAAAVVVGLAALWLVASGGPRGASADGAPRRAEVTSDRSGGRHTAPSPGDSELDPPASGGAPEAGAPADPSRAWREGFAARFAEAGERCGTGELRLLCREGACAARHPPLDAAYHVQRFMRRPRVIGEQLAQAVGLPPGDASCAAAIRRLYADVELIVAEVDGGGAGCRGYVDPSAVDADALVAELCAELASADP